MIDWVAEYESIREDALTVSDDFEAFARDHLIIQNKDGLLVSFTLNRAQQHFYRAIEESSSRFHLLIKARQLGFSTFIQGYQFWRACHSPLRGVTMAHDADTTQKMRRMSELFFEHLPTPLGVERITDNAAITRYMPHNSEITIATAGAARSKKSGGKGRGGTYNFFHGSEVAFWPNMQKTISGALQGLSGNGLCIFETTTNGAQGWVWELVNNPGKWQVHFYPWFYDEQYILQPDEPLEYTADELALIKAARLQGFILKDKHILWRRDKQAEVGLEFPQEYPETLQGAFVHSGNSVFGDVAHCLTASDNAKYNPKHRYVCGVDWGQEHDYTVASIIDATDLCEVALLRMNRLDYDVMQQRIVDLCYQWRVETIQPEKNSIGSLNIRYMREKFHAITKQHEQEVADDKRDEDDVYSITVRPFTMENKRKHKLVSLLYHNIHHGGLRLLPDDTATSELMSFEQTQTESGLYKYGATEGSHDDTVIARMLAVDAANRII